MSDDPLVSINRGDFSASIVIRRDDGSMIIGQQVKLPLSDDDAGALRKALVDAKASKADKTRLEKAISSLQES